MAASLAALSVHAAAADCDAVGGGFSFCWDETAFTPRPDAAGQYTNGGRSDGSETLLYFTSFDLQDGPMSFDDALAFVMAQDARFYRVPSTSFVQQGSYDLDIAGLPGKLMFYQVPAGTIAGVGIDLVQGRALAMTDDHLFVAYSSEKASTPGLPHIGDTMFALTAVERAEPPAAPEPPFPPLPQQPMAAAPGPAFPPAPEQPDTSSRQPFAVQQQPVAPTPQPSAACETLAVGVSICGLKGRDWVEYEPLTEGRFRLSLNEATAILEAGPIDGYTPPVTEPQRLARQKALNTRLVGHLTTGFGFAPAAVAVQNLVAVPAGETGLNAEMQVLRAGKAGEHVTFSSTLYLGPDHYAWLTTLNPGAATNEDHLSIVNDVMRSLRLPEQEPR